MANKKPRRKADSELRRCVRSLCAALSQLGDGALSIVKDENWEPRPDSPASEDINRIEAEVPRDPNRAHMTSDQIVGAASTRFVHMLDNTLATATIMRARDVGVYSQWGTARSAVESAAITWWVIGSLDDRMENRVERVLNDRIDSLRWASKFSKTIDQELSRATAERRIDELIQTGQDLGYTVSGRGSNRVLGEGRPRKSDLVMELPLPSDGTYNLFSGIAHADMWGLMDSIHAGEVQRSESFIKARPTATMDHYAFIATTLLWAWGYAFGRLVEYMGWDGARWDSVYEASRLRFKNAMDDANRLGTSPSRRELTR